MEARLEALEGERAVEAQLDAGLAVPDRAGPFLEFGPDRLGEEAAELGEEVEAGAVDDVLVVGDRGPGGGLQRQLDPLPLARRRQVDGAPELERAALLPRQAPDHGRVEDAAVAVLDEVLAALQVEVGPADVVGIGEDAVLEEALATAQRQHRRVDGDPRLRPQRPQEDQGREGALAAADDRHVDLAVGGQAGELAAPAVAVEQPRLGRRVVREGAVDAGPGEEQGAPGELERRAVVVALDVDHPALAGRVEAHRDDPPAQRRHPLGRPRQHPAEVGPVIAVEDRRRAGVDPRRVLAAFDRVALPAQRQQGGVELVADGGELARAAVREADVLDRRHRQRLFARGHPVQPQPGGGGLGFLDDRHRQVGQPEPVQRVDLGRDRRRLGPRADDQEVGDGDLPRVIVPGPPTVHPCRIAHPTITNPFSPGLNEIAALLTRSPRASTGCRSTAARTSRRTRFISSCA